MTPTVYLRFGAKYCLHLQEETLNCMTDVKDIRNFLTDFDKYIA